MWMIGGRPVRHKLPRFCHGDHIGREPLREAGVKQRLELLVRYYPRFWFEALHVQAIVTPHARGHHILDFIGQMVQHWSEERVPRKFIEPLKRTTPTRIRLWQLLLGRALLVAVRLFRALPLKVGLLTGSHFGFVAICDSFHLLGQLFVLKRTGGLWYRQVL